MPTTGQKIRAMRTYRHARAEDMAKMLCLSVGGYYNYEVGRVIPSLGQIEKIAERLDVKVEELIGDDWDKETERSIVYGKENATENLADKIAELTAEIKMKDAEIQTLKRLPQPEDLIRENERLKNLIISMLEERVKKR